VREGARSGGKDRNMRKRMEIYRKQTEKTHMEQTYLGEWV
jgi:hypothetical protein